jgi:arsenate reductase
VKPIRVLFLCTGNSARSLIAEAVLRQIGGDEFEAHSAGTRPKGVNPRTVRVLEQSGITATPLESKSLDLYVNDRDFDYVITVCDNAAEECPVFPGNATRLHWSFPDPAAVEGSDADMLDAFEETLRGMRETIDLFIPIARKHAASRT